MSSCLAPPTTSNGAIATVVGSSWFRSGTTLMRLVSMAPQVSVRVNRCPTCTALLSVFHQHLIGSTSTSPGAGAFARVWELPAEGGLAGAWAAADAPHDK